MRKLMVVLAVIAMMVGVAAGETLVGLDAVAEKANNQCLAKVARIKEKNPNQYQVTILETTCSITKDRILHVNEPSIVKAKIEIEIIRLDMVSLLNAVSGEITSNQLRGIQ